MILQYMVELKVNEILARASAERAYIMILQEKDGMRKLPVIMGPFEAQAVALAQRNVHLDRPIIHDLFRNFVADCGYTLDCVTIDKVAEGAFYASLHLSTGEKSVRTDARASDAVAVAMRCGSPIYIEDELLNTLCIKEEWENSFSIPLTLAATDTLREVMEKAIKEENYELAQKLKEEIDARMERKASGSSEETDECIDE